MNEYENETYRIKVSELIWITLLTAVMKFLVL